MPPPETTPPSPTPLKRFALQRPPLAPPGTVRIDQAPVPPPPFSPWQLWGQGLLESVVDPIRGALAGASGSEDTLAAKAGELFATLPPIAGVKNLIAGRGLYSRVDEALKLLPKKGAHPNKIASILKSNASSEELAYRGVPEFLASKGNATVTPADLAAHLAAHPAPVPTVKTLGEGISFDEWLQRTGHGPMTPDDTRSGLQAQLYSQYQRSQASAHPIAATRTKFSQYTLPGGEGYRETLVTLPETRPFDPSKVTFTRKPLSATQGSVEVSYEGKSLGNWNDPHELNPQTGRWEGQSDAELLEMVRRRYGGSRELGIAPLDAGTAFRSGHFDEPNILVHTRANERTLPTGERGRFVEEVQSDWHQQGKKRGYQSPTPETAPAPVAHADITLQEGEHSWMAFTPDGRKVEIGKGVVEGATDARSYAKIYFNNRAAERAEALRVRQSNLVPDAPFKETWPDLGLKQQVLETAADPNAQWIGFTSGQTQAARYDLSKQISRLSYVPDSPNDYSMGKLRAYDHEGKLVINESGIEPSQLDDYIGKEPAEHLRKKITEHQAARTYEREQWSIAPDPDEPKYFNVFDSNGELLHDYGGTPERYSTERRAEARINELLSEYEGMEDQTPSLTGLDLQVGGEGMEHFYDKVLPKRLEKIVKPFGGTVERAPLGGRSKAAIDAEMDAILERASASEGTITERYSDEVNRQLQVLQAERNKAHDGAPAWIARLSPEMKARILKEGLPLLSLTAFLAQMGQPPKESR